MILITERLIIFTCRITNSGFFHTCDIYIRDLDKEHVNIKTGFRSCTIDVDSLKNYVEQHSLEKAGEIGFRGYQKDEIEYGIYEQYRRNGYATEALIALKEYCLEYSLTPKLCILEDNLFSQRVAVKSGFSKVGHNTWKPVKHYKK